MKYVGNVDSSSCGSLSTVWSLLGSFSLKGCVFLEIKGDRN